MDILKDTKVRMCKTKAKCILRQHCSNNVSSEASIPSIVQDKEKAIEKNNDKALPKEEPPVEYVYAMESDAFPGLIKIGRTKNLMSRLQSSFTFTAPSPFRVLFSVETLCSERDESLAHLHFASQRECGEFFRVKAYEVQRFFNRVIQPVFKSELAAWKPGMSSKIDENDPMVQFLFRSNPLYQGCLLKDLMIKKLKENVTDLEEVIEYNNTEIEIRDADITSRDMEILQLKAMVHGKDIEIAKLRYELDITKCSNKQAVDQRKDLFQEELLDLLDQRPPTKLPARRKRLHEMTYSEQDRDLMEQAIREVVAKRTPN